MDEEEAGYYEELKRRVDYQIEANRHIEKLARGTTKTGW